MYFYFLFFLKRTWRNLYKKKLKNRTIRPSKFNYCIKKEFNNDLVRSNLILFKKKNNLKRLIFENFFYYKLILGGQFAIFLKNFGAKILH